MQIEQENYGIPHRTDRPRSYSRMYKRQISHTGSLNVEQRENWDVQRCLDILDNRYAKNAESIISRSKNGSSPLLSTGEAAPGTCSQALGSQCNRGMDVLERALCRAIKILKTLEHLCCEILKEHELFNLEKTQWDHINTYNMPEGREQRR